MITRTENTLRNEDRRSGPKALYATLLSLLLAACGGDSTDNIDRPTVEDPPPPVQTLTMHENAMVGLWSRYHRYDDSTDYKSFNSDRTGTEYTIENNGSRSDEKTVTYWALEAEADYVFRIRLAGPGISSQPLGYLSPDEFHYDTDEIWDGGSSILRMRKR